MLHILNADAMINVTDILYKAFIRYFNALSKLGYKSLDSVNKIIVLLFIQELLDNSNDFYLTEDDFKIFSRVIACITGSTCLVDMICSNTEDSLIHDSNIDSLFRLTEDSINRITQNNIPRIE